MILIADSGSTKTHWIILKSGVVENEVFTGGINPFYQTESEIFELIQTQLVKKINNAIFSSIFFYGAGCSFDEKKLMVSNALIANFGKIRIEVESDLLGAARGLFQHKQGIACILGTGSNSCYYDGNSIIENVSPLGFILGDEGSGAVLSKTLIADCLKKQLPQHISSQFLKKYNLTPSEILENVYKKPFPNRFLAQFTPFLTENIHEPSIHSIVKNGFINFFQRNISQYPQGNELGFVGSVAFFLRDVLQQVANEYHYKIVAIVKSPMDGLINYHSKD